MSRDPPDAAVVFDCDGLLLDTEEAWTRAETRWFARYGRSYGPQEKRLLIGGSLEGTARTLAELIGRHGRIPELTAELLDLAAEEFGWGVEPMPGAIDLVRELRGRRPIAVASNSPRRLVDLALDGAGLTGWFDAVIAGDEVPRPKPAPDLYLEACRRLGRPARQTVAIEDSPVGAASARAAGLYVIGVPYLPDLELDADLIATSLSEATVRAALGLADARSP
jgi:HAD superfamily hydrolase (TIGR01509 family)